MNIEIANRLQQLRKQKGYSQEQLADELGISRQAVSKWERAEASPDTDNLICLARLYGISLDELLSTEESTASIRASVKEEKTEKTEQEEKAEETDRTQKKKGIRFSDDEGNEVFIGQEGIHLVDEDGDEVHLGADGMHFYDEDGDEVHIGDDDVYYDKDGKRVHVKCGDHFVFIKDREESSGKKKVFDSVTAAFTVLIICAYFVLGGVWGLWHPGWILFLAIPVFASLMDAIYKKNPNHFAWPVLVTAVYLLLGCVWGLWHPWWILFLTIPLYYILADAFRK